MKLIIVLLFIIWIVIIVNILYCVGLILLGIIDEFGLFLGIEIFVKLVCGFEVNYFILLVIFIKFFVNVFNVLCNWIILLCVVSVWNLFLEDING